MCQLEGFCFCWLCLPSPFHAVLRARSVWMLVRTLIAATGAAAGDGLLLLLPLAALSLCVSAAALSSAGGVLLALPPQVALAWWADL